MTHKNMTRLLSLVTLCILIASSQTIGRGATPRSQENDLLGTLTCQTTRANGAPFAEHDTIESIGRWLHGTARPLDQGQREPYYDYYLRYDRAARLWIYIQLDPSHGTYFVGTSPGGAHRSLNGSTWSIVFPAEPAQYRFTESPQGFEIAYHDLTQVCTKESAALPAMLAPTLDCTTYKADGTAAPEERLSIAQPEGRLPWWQGVATDSSGRVIYEYNIFTAGLQRVSILINAATGTYSIATSRLQRDLNDTSWTVIYPQPENGFTFTGVTYQGTVPTSFTINFSDGYQRCATAG
jgi:hypothetical protein